MRGVSADELLRLPVRLHGIRLGRPVDLIVDTHSMRALGVEVRCGDELHRFLPLAAAKVGGEEIAVDSALMLLDDLEAYLRRARPLRSLRGMTVERAGRPAGVLKDVVLGEGGKIVEVVVSGDEGPARLPHNGKLKLAERKRLSAA